MVYFFAVLKVNKVIKTHFLKLIGFTIIAQNLWDPSGVGGGSCLKDSG